MEIEKVKAELKASRDAEKEKEMQLFQALDKYNPKNNGPSPSEVLQKYDKPGPFPTKSNNPYGIPPLPNVPISSNP
jgi:hypothetical protein